MNAAVLVCGFWLILLFAAVPTGQSMWDAAELQLQYTFSNENPHAWWFVWFAALPLICTVLGLVYLRNIARTRRARLGLFSISLALGTATFFLNDWMLAAFVAVPAIWAYRAVHAT